jgi:hypothetical protein
MNGKGSKTRPLSIPYEEYANNFDSIFRKKNYVLPVKETPEGDQYVEIPDELLKHAGWKEGDEIEMKKVKEGYELIKKLT